MRVDSQSVVSGRTGILRRFSLRYSVLSLVSCLLVACGSSVADTEPVQDTAVTSVSVLFEPTAQTLTNPERGFAGNAGDISMPKAQTELAGEFAAGFRIVRSYVRLHEFRSSALSTEFLDALSAGLDAAATEGMKVIPRFTYDPPAARADQIGYDASLAQVLEHIEQLAPVLQEHQAVIPFMEAGFIGAYGEWHSSRSGLDSTDNRRQIRDALLRYVPPGIYVLFRDPADFKTWFGNSLPSALAFDGSAQARSGFHNDCLLTGTTDGNTYPSGSPGLRELVADSALHVPFGGETCQLPDPQSSCSQILAAGQRYSITYLNWYFYRAAFHEVWEQEGCLEQVRHSLGYRLELTDASMPPLLRAGSEATLNFGLINRGWAPVYSKRELSVYFEQIDGPDTFTATLDNVDPRAWHAARGSHMVQRESAAIPVPAGLSPGRYRVAFGLADAAQQLRHDPRFSIRFANADRRPAGQYWDPASGLFFTGLITRITSAQN